MSRLKRTSEKSKVEQALGFLKFPLPDMSSSADIFREIVLEDKIWWVYCVLCPFLSCFDITFHLLSTGLFQIISKSLQKVHKSCSVFFGCFLLTLADGFFFVSSLVNSLHSDSSNGDWCCVVSTTQCCKHHIPCKPLHIYGLYDCQHYLYKSRLCIRYQVCYRLLTWINGNHSHLLQLVLAVMVYCYLPVSWILSHPSPWTVSDWKDIYSNVEVRQDRELTVLTCYSGTVYIPILAPFYVSHCICFINYILLSFLVLFTLRVYAIYNKNKMILIVALTMILARVGVDIWVCG